MRADRIAPVTWLLGAAAAWAVLGAALAWAGLGGRVAASGGAAVDAQPLPRPAARGEAIAPAPFDAFAARPPFAKDRMPHPFVLPGGDNDGARGDAAAFDFALTSVMITPRLRMAIVEPSQGGDSVRVREGDTAEGLGGWRLIELRPRAAVFEGPGGRRELPLRVWAGGGDGSMVAEVPPPEPPPEAPEPDAAAAARMPVDRASRPLSANTAPVPDAPASAAATAPSQVQSQMDAIRRRIEARRAQLRREARQSQDTSQDAPARNP